MNQFNKKKTGEFYWEMASISPVRDAQGTITHFVAVKEDITERKRAEEALRENEAHYRAIVEAFDGLIYICSQDYRVEFMNKQLIERTGYDGTGELCYKVLHNRDTVCSWCVNPRVFRGETVRWEVQSPKDNRWYYIVNTPIHHPDGSISKQAMILDITERKRAEEALRESEARWRSLTENSPDHILTLDKELIIEFANYASPGLTVAKLIGTPLYTYVAEERQAEIKALLEQVLKTGESARYETEYDSPDGGVIYYESRVAPRILHGEVVGLTLSARDITARKQAEKERLAHLRFLESLDQVNRAIQETNDLELMMRSVLDALLSIFACDRAWLVYPCDPDVATWQVSMERTRPEYPGVLPVGVELPLDSAGAAVYRILRDSPGPVQFGPGSAYQVPMDVTQGLSVQSFIAMALYPKVGKAWSFGLHQCSYPRVWTSEEERLFQEVGRRLADALTSLLSYRQVREREQALQQSNNLLRAIIEAAPTAIIGLDLDGKVQIVWNPAAEKMLGWSAQEAMGHLLPSVPADRHEEFRGFREWIRRGESLTGVEVRRQRRDGSPIDYSIYASPLYDAENRLIGNIAVLADITEHKRVQSIMQARLRLLEFAGSHSMDELLTATLDEIETLTGSTIGFYHFLEPDQETLSLQSWSTNTLKNMCTAEGKGSHYDIAQAGVWVDCVHERRPVIHDDYASLPHRKGLPEGHAPVIREVVVPIFRDNLIKAIIGVGNKSTPYNESDIEIVSQLGDLSWDITERKRAEEALHESEKQFRLLAENSTDLISRHSPDGTYLYASPACWNLLGYIPDELIGHSAYEFFHPADAPAVRQSHTTIMDQPVTYTVQYRIRRKDGNYIWFETTSRTIRNSQTGAVIEIQAASRDITARKRAEEAEQHRRRIAETLVKAAAVLNSTLDLEQVLDLILQQLRRAIDYDSASFLKMEEEHLVISACQGFSKPHDVLGVRFSLDPRLPIHRVVTEKSPLHLADVGQEYPHFQDKEITDSSHHIHTWLGVPVLSKDRVIGVIALDRLEVRPFTNEDIELAGAFANQAAIAIENARLHKQTQRYAEELEQRVEERTRDLQQEILERKRAEEALRESEARHRIIAELTSDYIYAIIVHPDGTAKTGWMSDAVERITGYTDEEIRALPGGWNSIVHPDGITDFAPLWLRLLSGQTVVHEYQITTKSGEVRWLRDYKKPIWNEEEERVILIWGAVQDVTERKQAQAALTEQNNQIQTLLDNVPAFVYFKDVESRFILSNAAHLHSMGKQTVDEVIGKTDLELFPLEMAKQFYADEQELFRTGQPLVNREELSLNEAGEVMWASTTKVPLRDQQGKIVGLVGVTQDITERKQDKEKIERYATQLEETNRQLLALSRVKDEFVSNVSHELRTPITNLKLRHHLLAARPDRWENHLAVMARETKRLEDIIESLLYLSRLDQARVDWNPIPVDLNHLVSQFVRDRVALAQSGELSLSFTGAPDLPLVEADAALWEQALSILLTNAFNYTPAGGQVEVRTQVREHEGQRWVGVSVSDTGPGISPDEQTRLFERFFRGTAGRESGTPGTGLGLSIVQEIVNKHRGRVEVFSEGVPGKGATFSLWLLAVESVDENRQTPKE